MMMKSSGSLKLSTKSAFFYLICFFSLLLLSSVCIAESIEVIGIKYRRADEVVPMVKNFLSQDGKVTVDRRTNSLVVVDEEDSIQKVREFLKNYDKPIQQVTVYVRFKELRSEKGGSVSADARVSGDGWSVFTGGKTEDGVDVRVKGRKSDSRNLSEYYVRIASGSPAVILAGKEIPYTDQWLYLCGKYANISGSIGFHTIDSGFEVVPVVMSDRVSIDITPQISYEADRGKPGIIRFTRAATTILVPMDEWVEIGGTSGTDNEVITAILESGSRTKNSKLSISLKVISD